MKTPFKSSHLLIFFILFQIQSYGQSMLKEIELEQIEHKTIRKYIKRQIKGGKQVFNDIQPSWNKGDDLSHYNKNVETFTLEENIQYVWHSYLSIAPSKMWNNRIISKDLILQKSPEKLFYNNDFSETTNIGQVYFLNLKILSGIYNQPVVFEIITIDHVEMIIEFSYVKGNHSSGVQQIKFTATEDNTTRIIHTTYYKSNSNFRDKWLYPVFHKKITTDFHENIAKLLETEKSYIVSSSSDNQ